MPENIQTIYSAYATGKGVAYDSLGRLVTATASATATSTLSNTDAFSNAQIIADDIARQNAEHDTTLINTFLNDLVSDTVPDADATTKGKIQLSGDLGGTSSAPTIPGLLLKASINNPTFTGIVSGITQSMVGLSNVDNTSDLSKPVSTSTQSALDLKAPISNPTFTGSVSGITKSMVGLSNVDNTSDLSKPISTSTQAELDLKKTFIINHPLDDSKYLVHACLEGPEAGIYYRGDGEITNNESTYYYFTKIC